MRTIAGRRWSDAGHHGAARAQPQQQAGLGCGGRGEASSVGPTEISRQVDGIVGDRGGKGITDSLAHRAIRRFLQIGRKSTGARTRGVSLYWVGRRPI